MLLEKELVEGPNSVPKSQFLRITRNVSRVIESSANDMDLCTTTQVVPSPLRLKRMRCKNPMVTRVGTI